MDYEGQNTKSGRWKIHEEFCSDCLKLKFSVKGEW